ncbi:MAG: hypothetical protein IH892_12965 [Planctomycetes bacterium]|nr:hypothetical protein [Planctomycetota bacterium]MCH8217668.1 hypothetical protein [Planctomycetota bacterium]
MNQNGAGATTKDLHGLRGGLLEPAPNEGSEGALLLQAVFRAGQAAVPEEGRGQGALPGSGPAGRARAALRANRAGAREQAGPGAQPAVGSLPELRPPPAAQHKDLR